MNRAPDWLLDNSIFEEVAYSPDAIPEMPGYITLTHCAGTERWKAQWSLDDTSESEAVMTCHLLYCTNFEFWVAPFIQPTPEVIKGIRNGDA